MSAPTYHRWQQLYGGMKATEAKRIKELAPVNIRLKRLLVEAELDKRCSSPRPGAAVGVSRGKLLSPERRRRAVCLLQDRFRVSQRRACRLAGQNRNTQRRPVPVTAIDEQKLRRRIRELARRHVRWGRRLVYRRLRLEGWTVSHKRVQRIWREEGLQRPLPRRRKRSRPPGGNQELLRAEYPLKSGRSTSISTRRWIGGPSSFST